MLTVQLGSTLESIYQLSEISPFNNVTPDILKDVMVVAANKSMD